MKTTHFLILWGLLAALDAPGQVSLLNHRRIPPPTSTALITNYSPTTLRNNYTGWVGFYYSNDTAITATHLGRWIVSGNSGTHTLIIIDEGDNSMVASNQINTAGLPTNAFSYVEIPPAALSASKFYAVVSSETSGGDQWYETVIRNEGVTTGAYGGVTYGTSLPSLTTVSGYSPYGPTNLKWREP